MPRSKEGPPVHDSGAAGRAAIVGTVLVVGFTVAIFDRRIAEINRTEIRPTPANETPTTLEITPEATTGASEKMIVYPTEAATEFAAVEENMVNKALCSASLISVLAITGIIHLRSRLKER